MATSFSTFRDVYFVRTVAELKQRQRDVVRLMHGRRPDAVIHTSATPRRAYVNSNRWVVDCQCGSGCIVVTAEAHQLALCFECGAQHVNVYLPPEREEIERVLMERPLANRNWFVTESLEDLKRENAERGIA